MRKRLTVRVLGGILSATLLLGGSLQPVLADDPSAKALENAKALGAQASYEGTPVTTNEIKDWPKGPAVFGETAVLMDADTGIVLYNKGMDEVRYPASITKIMTALVALENSGLDEKVTFTETGVRDAIAGNANIGMQVGEVLTMEQCLYAVMLFSANEVSAQVAEHVGGTEAHFIEMMNQKAQELGCKNTHFVNASGLHDPNHVTTAHDMALILKGAMENEMFAKITGTTNYSIPPTNINGQQRDMFNHHALLYAPDWYYAPCIGGKTGNTEAAGNTLATVAEKDGMRLISIVMKVSDGGRICADTINLMEYGFNNFQDLQMTEAEKTISGGVATVPKAAGKEDVKTKTAGQGEEQSCAFTYQGYEVGTAIVQAPEETPEPADIEETPQLQDNKEAGGQGAGRLFKGPVIAIGVLGVLVLLGLLVIVLKVTKNRKGR